MKLITLLLTLGLAGNLMATDEQFNATMELLSPITITEVNALTFPDAVAGTAQAITVLTTDAGAAEFNASGTANTNITTTVVEASINMSDGGGNDILVDSFTNDAPAAFDGTGNANGINVGATANIEATDPAGSYSGTATLRIVYQ